MNSLKARILGAALIGTLYVAGSGAAADSRHKIVLIGGAKSEGAGRHDYPNGVAVLEKLLRSSPAFQNADVDIETHPQGWPRESAFDGAATLVWYFDGLEKHPLNASERNARFQTLMRAGVGLVVLHQATTVPDDPGFDLPRWLGGARYGMFDRATEMAEITPAAPAHPVSRGVTVPFAYMDEFYPTIRWAAGENVTPILKARLHVEWREGRDLVIGDPITSTVAWAYERADGGRAFAFTGAHYLVALDEPSIRKTLLNAIAWTAHIEVPANGIRSLYPNAAAQAVRE